MEWGRRLGWTDEDMLHRAIREGGSSEQIVVQAGHGDPHAPSRASPALRGGPQIGGGGCHGGLDFDGHGTPAIRFVAVVVPKKSKWKLGEDGSAVRVRKWRVTTDDSIAAAGTDYRNDEIDRSDLGNVTLSTVQQLARAITIVRTSTILSYRS